MCKFGNSVLFDWCRSSTTAWKCLLAPRLAAILKCRTPSTNLVAVLVSRAGLDFVVVDLVDYLLLVRRPRSCVLCPRRAVFAAGWNSKRESWAIGWLLLALAAWPFLRTPSFKHAGWYKPILIPSKPYYHFSTFIFLEYESHCISVFVRYFFLLQLTDFCYSIIWKIDLILTFESRKILVQIKWANESFIDCFLPFICLYCIQGLR